MYRYFNMNWINLIERELMSGVVDTIDAVLIRHELREIAQQLENISNKGIFWDVVIPLLIAGAVAVLASMHGDVSIQIVSSFS